MRQQGTNVVLDLDAPERETKVDVVDEDGKIATAPVVDGDIVDEDFDPEDRLPPRAVRNSDGTVTLSLRYPQTIVSRKDGKTRERTYNELVFHRLTGADQRAIAAASDDMTAVVAIGQSTKINQAVMNALFDKMDAADTSAAGQVLNHFFGEWPEDWQVKLGALADGTGFTAAEIETFDIGRIVFWWNCLMAWRVKEQELSKGD